ncbi:folate-dependent phosphoribosylglycinamide formyltransferase PurN [Salinibacter ruber]|uniref:formyltransferase family protein n=1 Tax=Salinibacter ruber TaxID=146919 RepID=UPI0024508B44|nr:folate-dependent phosphoribosylglycinamide formyltransferase PurN [Salinibacter ruber]MCS3714672.1 folate-dependent phosphoribosylglycinamide formyltransferase PurN [Salinibacter ruber]
MKSPRVILTAGFNRARNVLAIAELLRRRNVRIERLLVVSPYSWGRLRTYVRREGLGAVWDVAPRLFGWEDTTKRDEETSDPLRQLYERHDIERQSLSSWAKTYDVPFLSVTSLNGEEAVGAIETANVDWVIYGGGGILRESFIDAACGRILNAHSGPLPEVRGMNACEWALLLGHEPTVTVHLINQGIDTGGIISEHPAPIRNRDSIEQIRKRCVAVGVKALCETVLDPPERLPETRKGADKHRQCFVLAPALEELLQKRLAQGEYQGQ